MKTKMFSTMRSRKTKPKKLCSWWNLLLCTLMTPLVFFIAGGMHMNVFHNNVNMNVKGKNDGQAHEPYTSRQSPRAQLPNVKSEVNNDASVNISSNDICPPADKAVDASFPPGFPQKLIFGRYHKSKAKGRPFITQDCWADLVDNKRTFFLRPTEHGFPSAKQLSEWIQSRPHPINLVINNQLAMSWPPDLKNKHQYDLILNQPNLNAVYAGNVRSTAYHPKLKPLPVGPKWNWEYTQLFSEDKEKLTKLYGENTATTPEGVEALFRSKDRTPTVYVRSMVNSNSVAMENYVRDNPALQMLRFDIGKLLKSTAKQSVVFNKGKLSQPEYFAVLKKHRFAISPAGQGLDTHGTWEALMAGCIPIVPSSPLDPLFEDLPVWLVKSWEEVTDESIKKMDEEMRQKEYKWEKLFVPFWKEEIHRGLCKLS